METHQGYEAASDEAASNQAASDEAASDADPGRVGHTAARGGEPGAASVGDGFETTTEIRDQQHLEAAVRMVASGASRWVIVSGVRDARGLLERNAASGREISVTALAANAVLVARPETLPELTASIRPPQRRGWLARAGHLLASVLR